MRSSRIMPDNNAENDDDQGKKKRGEDHPEKSSRQFSTNRSAPDGRQRRHSMIPSDSTLSWTGVDSDNARRRRLLSYPISGNPNRRMSAMARNKLISTVIKSIDENRDRFEALQDHGKQFFDDPYAPRSGEQGKGGAPDRVHYIWGRNRSLVQVTYCRYRIHGFVESRLFNGIILIVILLNTGTLVARTFPTVRIKAGFYLTIFDNIFLGIYITEAVLKLVAYHLAYFTSVWNILDFIVVVFNLAELVIPFILQGKSFAGTAILRLFRIFKAIRALRALRVLRTIKFLSSLNAILTTCFESLQSIGSIVLLMSLVLYMFAVIGRGLFAKLDPPRFGSLSESAMTLFKLLTLDDWFNIVLENNFDYGIFVYLFIYIVIEQFVFLNLFVAVLLDNFQLTLEVSTAERRKAKKETLWRDLNDSEAESEEEENESEGETKFNSKRKPAVVYYKDTNLSPKELACLEQHLQLLPTLDYYYYQLQQQQSLINSLVDMCAFEETQD